MKIQSIFNQSNTSSGLAPYPLSSLSGSALDAVEKKWTKRHECSFQIELFLNQIVCTSSVCVHGALWTSIIENWEYPANQVGIKLEPKINIGVLANRFTCNSHLKLILVQQPSRYRNARLLIFQVSTLVTQCLEKNVA